MLKPNYGKVLIFILFFILPFGVLEFGDPDSMGKWFTWATSFSGVGPVLELGEETLSGLSRQLLVVIVAALYYVGSCFLYQLFTGKLR